MNKPASKYEAKQSKTLAEAHRTVKHWPPVYACPLCPARTIVG